MKIKFLGLIIFPTPLLGNSFFTAGTQNFALGPVAMILLGLGFLIIGAFLMRRPNSKKAGFLRITPHHKWVFFPINLALENLEPMTKSLSTKRIQVYANTSKMLFSKHNDSYFLEDKNFKNSVLVNRRRRRRYGLNHGTVLDIGELCLMFINPAKKPKTTHKRPENLSNKGKILKNCPVLNPTDKNLTTFYLSKNVNYIGSSTTCDLTIQGYNIQDKHAKISKIAGQYRLTNLIINQNTYVNGRKIEEHLLKPNDEIAFDNIRYRFADA